MTRTVEADGHTYVSVPDIVEELQDITALIDGIQLTVTTTKSMPYLTDASNLLVQAQRALVTAQQRMESNDGV